MFLIFTPKIGDDFQFDDMIFFKWVVQPPTRLATHFFWGEIQVDAKIYGKHFGGIFALFENDSCIVSLGWCLIMIS